MPPRSSSDRRAASSQLRVAEQSARVGKDTRAKGENDALTVPLVHEDKEGVKHSQEFRLADEVGVMPLMEWVAAAEGNQNETGKSLVAIFHVLEDTVHEDEWDEFREYGRENKIQAKPYGDFINAALEAIAGRPTEESSGS